MRKTVSPHPRPLYDPFPVRFHSPQMMVRWVCEVARSYVPDLWHDHWGEIFPSDLWCEELVHHAARPLITRIAWTQDAGGVS